MREGAMHLLDEVLEFLCSPSLDELSDVCYAVNRLSGGMLNRKYIRVIPFDTIHIAKCNKRYVSYGHFRSRRHIV